MGGGGKENIALLNMAIIYFGEKFVHWRLAIIYVLSTKRED